MKGSKFACMLVAALLIAVFCALPAQAVTIKYSSPTPPSHIMTKQANKVKADLEKASGGKYKVEVHPFSKLGKVPTIISLLQAGALEIAAMPIGDLALRDPAFYAWFVPQTFKDLADAYKATQTEAAKQMLGKMEKQGMVYLAYVFPGQRHVISTEPVKSMDDFQGKKVRAFPNDAFKEWWKALGAAPAAVRLPEIPQSLQTGVLDAVDVDLDIVVGLKLYKQAPYLVMTNHMCFPGVVLASKKWWDKLSADDQAMIKKIFKDAEHYALSEQTRVEEENLATLKKEGVTVEDIDLSVLKPAAAKVKGILIKKDPMVQKFLDDLK